MCPAPTPSRESSDAAVPVVEVLPAPHSEMATHSAHTPEWQRLLLLVFILSWVPTNRHTRGTDHR